jgi:hypothetical protein
VREESADGVVGAELYPGEPSGRGARWLEMLPGLGLFFVSASYGQICQLKKNTGDCIALSYHCKTRLCDGEHGIEQTRVRHTKRCG